MQPTDRPRSVIGWDIGGAHVKAALWTSDAIRAVVQRSCPLWQGLEHLDRALDEAMAFEGFEAVADHAVTMTGEMADCFENRSAGVARIAMHLRDRLGERTSFFAGPSGWCASQDARERWRDIASANWFASATLAAQRHPDAILIDVGSTTTDLVPIVRGRVAARGRDDASRLASRELVYHGVVRTPLAALASRIAFRGRELNVMNEWFATSADIYRLSGELVAEHDQHPAADNRDKSEPSTCARLARMIGHDAADATSDEWRAFAATWRELQLREVEANVRHVIADSALPERAIVIGAGCGDFVARTLASRLGRDYIAFDALLDVDARFASWARVCAPSVAVAALFGQERDRACREDRR